MIFSRVFHFRKKVDPCIHPSSSFCFGPKSISATLNPRDIITSLRVTILAQSTIAAPIQSFISLRHLCIDAQSSIISFESNT